MSSVNRVILIGNLTRDPQLRYLPSGAAVVDFGLATNRKWKDQGGQEREEVCFVDVSAFGKQAELINQHLKKGSPIFIEGRLSYSVWDDKNGGGKRSKLSVVVENFQFIGGREGGQGGAPRQRAEKPAEQPRSESPVSKDQHFTEDSIPF